MKKLILPIALVSTTLWVSANPTCMHNGHEYVDLGLPSGTLWATCNVGADKPEEHGDFFAWGEITPKEEYSWNSYSLCNGSEKSLTKYTVDKIQLVHTDDVAHTAWGGKWRMPTIKEIEELLNTCTWTWSNEYNVDGYKVIGKNGKYIFLSVAGFRNGMSVAGVGVNGYYWSSSLYTNDAGYAWYLNFRSGDRDTYDCARYYGMSVRPVCSAK